MPPHRYQVGLLGRADERADRFAATLRRRVAELGLGADDLVVLDEAAIPARDRKSAFAGVFFGYEGADDRDHPVLRDLVEDAAILFPVVDDLLRFPALIPASLRALNGYRLDPVAPDTEHLSGLVLEALRLLRAGRRLFISYKRLDSRDVAVQVYETMDARTFDVFLDTHSIAPGEPFQDELWHRMADTDVVILLDTPGFRESHWTMQELARANATNLQILQVRWPRPTPTTEEEDRQQREWERQAAFSRFVPVTADDFVDGSMLGPGARLCEAALARIAVEAESLRARALAARMTYLVESFCKSARAHALAPVVEHRLIDLKDTRKGTIAVIPAIGVPDARVYQEVSDRITDRLAGRREDRPGEVWLLYDERGIRRYWLDHLAWLSRHVPIRGVTMAESDSALRDVGS